MMYDTGRVIYIVMGETGEYSDHSDWSVCAYENEDTAKQHVADAEAWLLANECSYSNHADSYMAPEKQCPFDPGFRCDYTGTRYYYYGISVCE